ncbi:MAG: hypothetical protein RJB58_384 [Pseudomonadota bacterium]|jgi:uncharacterized membrane protein YeiH
MSLTQLLTLAGVAVFAASGALAAGRRSLDPIGVMVLAIVTATGGGTLRDVLMDRPIFWIHDPSIIGVSIAAAAVTWLWVRRFPPPDKALQYADALGLAFFSIVGTRIAEAAGLSPFICIIMGALTGCAGGLIRDVLVAEVPLVFRQSELYVTACLAGIGVHLLLAALGMPTEFSSMTGIATIALIRIVSIRHRITLPVFHIPPRPDV